MAKKLQNIKAIKQMLDGSHKSQTKIQVGGPIDKTKVNRKVGERWTETDPISGITKEWEQKDGYRIKVGKFQEVRDYLNSFPNCPNETCTCTQPGQADKKMKIVHGMCLDCVIDMEHKLKIAGTYEKYKKEKIVNNVKAFFKQTDKEVEIIKESLKSKVQFVNYDGSLDGWDAQDKDKILKKVDVDYIKLKKEYFKEFGIEDK